MDINTFQFDNLSTVRILVVGDVMLDRYFFGDTTRISPEAPVPVVKVSNVNDKAGGAANVARNISHLGAHVGLLGLVGCDDHADTLRNLLLVDQVESHLIETREQPTITKTRVLSRQQQVIRLDCEETYSVDAAHQIEVYFNDICDNYDVIVFSDYNKGALKKLNQMILKARQLNKIILVDPKNSDFSFYGGVDVITPNMSEFHAAGGCSASDDDILQSARRLLKKFSIGAMLLTRSERGMTWITAASHQHFPAQVREVTDVTGAGDTVIASLASFLGAGFDALSACYMANIAAGIVVTKLGASSVSLHEITRSFGGSSCLIGSKNIESVFQEIERAKTLGEKIVFTNGCFDILHAGHVRYLSQAAALGSRLVVGLNTDSSVSRLKGAERPVNSWTNRASVLAALKCVDWVLPFGENIEDEDSPLQLIKQVNPHVLVKGGDYSLENVIGADHVLANGGAVHVLDFLDSVSTTKIINKIKFE